jgi:hypothetical protein
MRSSGVCAPMMVGPIDIAVMPGCLDFMTLDSSPPWTVVILGSRPMVLRYASAAVITIGASSGSSHAGKGSSYSISDPSNAVDILATRSFSVLSSELRGFTIVFIWSRLLETIPILDDVLTPCPSDSNGPLGHDVSEPRSLMVS